MSVDWFRKPVEGLDGTLNACYQALDRHVVRGRADDVAVRLAGRDWTFAALLEQAGAFAGVLRAFDVGPGDTVAVVHLPAPHGILVALAVARVGAVASYDVDDIARAKVVVAPSRIPTGDADCPLITLDDSSELPWDTVMRAGRANPAGCAEVPADALLAVVDGRPVSLLGALGVSDDQKPVAPEGATLVDVGGLALWSFDAPGAEA